MWARVIDGQIERYLQNDAEFRINDQLYVSGWLRKASLAEKHALNIYEVVFAERPNEATEQITAFNAVFDAQALVVNVTFTVVAKPLAPRKRDMVSNVRHVMKSLMEPTDFIVVRALEKNSLGSVPGVVSTFRDSVMTRRSQLEASIGAATTHGDLNAIDVSSGWPDPLDF